MSIQSGLPKTYSQIRRKGGGTIDQVDAPVAASQTINKGDWLKLSSNKAAQALAKGGSPSLVLNGASPGLYGYALGSIVTDANGVVTDGTGRTTLPVALFNDDTEVMVGIYNASAANTTQAVATGSSAPINYELGIVTNATGQWSYNLVYAATPTNPAISLVEKSPESSLSEQYGFVWVKPLASARVGA